MRRAFAFLITLTALTAMSAPMAAAQSKFELSPFAGVRTAGSFRGEDQLVSYNVQSAPTFGVFADYFVTRQLALEFLWGHEGSTVEKKTASLGTTPTPTPTDGTVLPEVPDGELFDLSVDYFHGGIRYDGGNEKYTPYVAVGAGLTRFGPDVSGVSALNRFGFSLGAGLNAYLTDRIGVRFDARAFGSRTGDRQEDLACGVFGCVSFTRSSTFWQSHFVGAVIIRF
jgi:opacity protein-like surface antigen